MKYCRVKNCVIFVYSMNWCSSKKRRKCSQVVIRTIRVHYPRWHSSIHGSSTLGHHLSVSFSTFRNATVVKLSSSLRCRSTFVNGNSSNVLWIEKTRFNEFIWCWANKKCSHSETQLFDLDIYFFYYSFCRSFFTLSACLCITRSEFTMFLQRCTKTTCVKCHSFSLHAHKILSHCLFVAWW